jgi:glucosamine--fructose-6-phosphate aminotransferase (isomerizing)
MNKFIEEILEQPKALQNTLDYYTQGNGRNSLERIVKLWKEQKFDQIVFTGMGSSFFASNAASCLLSKYGISSFVINAGELLHYHWSIIKSNTLLVCVSQSGESYEIVRIMEKIPENVICIGISNEENSTLVKKSKESLLTRAGREDMTSTKTYISTAMVMIIFSLALAGQWKEEKLPALQALVGDVKKIISEKDQWLADALKILDFNPFIQIIGRGPVYPSVLQGALMFMEGARNPSAGIYGGEFRHGPLEMVRKGFKAIVIAPLGNTYQQSLKLIDDIIKFQGQVVMITNNSENHPDPDVYTIRVPYSDEYYSSIAAIIPLQFIVNQWAVDNGNEPGNFTRGAKVTVVE